MNFNNRPIILKTDVAYKPKERGFSLVELMVAIALLAIVSIGIMQVFSSSTRNYTVQDAKLKAEQSVRACLEYMSRDIRHAGYDQDMVYETGDATGTAKILTSDATQLTFEADFDESGAIDQPDETTTYQLNGDTIEKIDGNGTVYPILDNVTTLAFSYFGTANMDLGFPMDEATSDIRAIGVEIVVDQPAGRAGTIERRLDTLVLCRNLWFHE